MTPALHRTIFAGFAVLTSAVAVNVAFLQPTATPDPRRLLTAGVALSETLVESPPVKPNAKPAAQPHSAVPRASALMQPVSPVEHGARRFARLRTDSAHVTRLGDSLPDAPDAEGEPATISAVQRELSARGYGPLSPDGVPGLATRAAIMAFEYDHHCPLKGEATASLLARLVLGGSASDLPDPAAGLVRSPQAEIVMRTVQQSLVALGYQVGKIDGRTGEDIARAIREFELDEGLKQTGRVSAEVFTRLGRVVAAAKPKPVQ